MCIQCFYFAGLPPSAEGDTEVKDLLPMTEVKGHLKRLILEGCSSVKDEGMCLLSQHNVPVLEVVNMSQCQLLTGVAIKSLASVSMKPLIMNYHK